MAYICGIVTAEEKKELARRGWDPEPCPEELRDHRLDDDEEHEYVMFFVDTDVFDVMSGPDWDKGSRP